jgi:4-hydroxy-tetrahydrodipicolinate synthase
MITPFNDDGTIDYATLEQLIEWYIACGCTGLFAVCQSSEMYHLTNEERIALATFVKTKANGRVSVVASGTFGGPIEEQAAFVNKMGEIVDAVVVLVNQLATAEEDDEAWVKNAEKLLSLTGTVPLGLYECPQPYHRLLSAKALGWCAQSGRFLFHKDTCCNTKGILDKIAATAIDGTPFRFYNANMATLKFSLERGGSGFSGIAANFYPQFLSWLCANAGHPKAVALQQFLSIAENVVMYKYPSSAKAFLAKFDGLDIKPANNRNGCPLLNEEEDLKLEALHAMTLTWCKELGIERLNPATGKSTDAVPDSLAK